MKITTAYALAWIAISVAVTAGIIVTGSLMPLWTFLIPASISIKGDG